MTSFIYGMCTALIICTYIMAHVPARVEYKTEYVYKHDDIGLVLLDERMVLKSIGGIPPKPQRKPRNV